MKRILHFSSRILPLLLLPFGLAAQQNDDVYYDPSDREIIAAVSEYDAPREAYRSPESFTPAPDYTQADPSTPGVTNIYNYYDPDYDYYYTSRLRRFYNPMPVANFGYFSPYFIDSYWYDPFSPGLNIYISFGNNWGWNRPWNNWGWNNPWNGWGGWNNWGWNNPWNTWGCNNPWNNWGWNRPWNNWGAYNAGQWNNGWNNGWYGGGFVNNYWNETSPGYDDYYYGPRRPTAGNNGNGVDIDRGRGDNAAPNGNNPPNGQPIQVTLPGQGGNNNGPNRNPAAVNQSPAQNAPTPQDPRATPDRGFTPVTNDPVRNTPPAIEQQTPRQEPPRQAEPPRYETPRQEPPRQAQPPRYEAPRQDPPRQAQPPRQNTPRQDAPKGNGGGRIGRG
jgi:hypothetical protein